MALFLPAYPPSPDHLLLRFSSSTTACVPSKRASHPASLTFLPPSAHCRVLHRPAITNVKKVGALKSFLVRATIEQASDGQLQQMADDDDEVCELVSGLELTLGEGDDTFDAYLIKAIKNNNGSAVLLLTDILGYNNDDTRDFAYRLSCFGYNVLVPDLFRGQPWDNERSMNEYEEWRAKHSVERITKDIDTSAKWLLEEIAAAGVSKKLGLVGFCFGGGRLIEALARDIERQFAAAVCFYGTRFDPSLAAHIKAPILFITGDSDNLCPVEMVRSVTSQVEGSEARIYPGRGHAFAHHPKSPEEDEDAEDAFIATRSWLHNNFLLEAK